jgi:hypothetical protein
MRVSNEAIQHAINLEEEHGREKACEMLGLAHDTLRRYQSEAGKRGIKPDDQKVKLPVIFVYDLENAPTRAAVWGMWKQNVNQEAISEEWYMLSWSGKYLFDTEVLSDVLTPEEAKAGDDKRIMLSLWEHINNADILIGHNLNAFDVLKMNTRFVINDIMPPSPYQTIDTLLAARKNFSFTSNKLDYLCKQFGVARKADNGGMKRWMGCMDGNPQDLIDMEKYNKQDIVATEELYFALRPYIKNHPNLALYMNSTTDACYRCGSQDIEWLPETYYYTTVNKFPVYKCNKCHGHGRSRFSAMSKDDRKHITSPIAR